MSFEINNSLEKLISYIESESFSGWDIYDGLSIFGDKKIIHNPLVNFGFTQVFKWSPVNLRPVLGYKKIIMPKAMGLFLLGYSVLYKKHKETTDGKNYLEKAKFVVNWLKEHSLPNYSGPCWNFGFNYKFMFDKPTVVITSIIAKGLYEYIKVTGDDEVKKIFNKIPSFVLNDLHIAKTEPGICFSYTPIESDFCYNATLFAAEILARAYTFEMIPEYKELALKSADYVMSKQHPDGSWNYSLDAKSNKERAQVDFHQGFIIESLYTINRLLGPDPAIDEAIRKGLTFYRNFQFKNDGRGLWRFPKFYPIDIHNQAQGIITFSLLHEYSPEYLPFARKIAKWTIKNMQDKEGYFYYQKRRFYNNKISYMRWSNAWMFAALAELQYRISDL